MENVYFNIEGGGNHQYMCILYIDIEKTVEGTCYQKETKSHTNTNTYLSPCTFKNQAIDQF